LSNLHAPLSLKADFAKGLVIFIHGFMGSPRQFDDLAETAYNNGFSTLQLLLPGHGSTLDEFCSFKFQQLQNHVYAEIESHACTYSDIWLVGHSMGGLLALCAAEKFGEGIRGVFSIACPFTLTLFSAKALKLRLTLIFAKRSNPIKSAYLDDSSVPTSSHLIWHVASPFFELKKLMHHTKALLPKIKVPVFAIYSAEDETVSIKSLSTLKSGLGSTSFSSFVLSNSLHAYYTKHEREEIKKSLLEFIEPI